MVIVFVVCLVAGILMMVLGKHDSYHIGLVTGWGIALTIIGAMLVFGVWAPIYVGSYMRLAKMEAFYEANRSAYEATVETTKSAFYHISKQPGLQISVENLQQSTNWSDRLAELRDEVVKYNTCIYKLRRYNATWVLSSMFANPRSDLKLILLQE